MYNLLLVDDEPLIKVAFQSAVEWGKNGFLLAATASNGQEALHIVETQHIDAVITDLKMPGMDGLALIHELKKRSFTGPILVLSNYSDFDSVRTALTDGAYDYFLKINMNGKASASIWKRWPICFVSSSNARRKRTTDPLPLKRRKRRMP